jgi:ABC-type sugar transport system ATPase subunit
MSVRQNMAFGLKMRRTPRREIEKRVAEAAEILSIEQLLDRRPRELSGGQRQRVALGRAIVREPKVFLFDEPLSNLDAKLRVQMRAEIARLHQRLKTTIIYVTHDQVEAMTLGDRIVLLDRGVIQQVDTPMHIYQRPANQFVASFIGSPAMNFISGQIDNGAFQFAGTNGHPAQNVAIGDKAPNGPAVLGVRPEDLLVATDDPSGGARPSVEQQASRPQLRLGAVTLDVVEHMGHETIAHFALAGSDHVARLPADAGVGPGDHLSLSIRPGAFHLFSAADGRRLN